MAGLWVIAVFLIACSVTGQQTGYDCNQRPPFPPDIKNCCKRPTLNLDKYKDICSNSTGRFGMRNDDNHAFKDPCLVECIYTQAGALSDGRFNMANLKTLVAEVMPNDPDLANIFSTAFQTCGPETQKKMQEFEANRPLNAQGQPIPFPGPPPPCSPFAVMTTFCAMRYTFINCPASLWTTSDMCNSAQNYLKNCEPMQFGGPRRHGRHPRGTMPPEGSD